MINSVLKKAPTARNARSVLHHRTQAKLLYALIYTNLNISDSKGVTASMFTAGCQSVISRRTFSLGLSRRLLLLLLRGPCCLTVSHASRAVAVHARRGRQPPQPRLLHRGGKVAGAGVFLPPLPATV